jgi:hypothetical protein
VVALTLLDLSSANSSGTISTELGRPTRLLLLDLRSTDLTETIPSKLRTTASLTELGASFRLSGGADPEAARQAP